MKDTRLLKDAFDIADKFTSSCSHAKDVLDNCFEILCDNFVFREMRDYGKNPRLCDRKQLAEELAKLLDEGHVVIISVESTNCAIERNIGCGECSFCKPEDITDEERVHFT